MNFFRTGFILLFLFPLSGYGQNNFRSNGTVELGGGIGFLSQSYANGNGSSSTFSADIFIGIMAAPGFEIGIRPGFANQSGDYSGTSTYELYINPEYNFNTSDNIYPFLGLIGGYNMISHQSGGANYGGPGGGAEAGIKIGLKSTGLLLFKFEYLSQEYKSGSFGHSSSNETINNLFLGAGFRLFLIKQPSKK